MNKPTAIITGGAGFVGSALTEALLKDQWRVIAVDDFYLGTKRHVNEIISVYGSENYTFVKADVSVPHWHTQLPHTPDAPVFFHLAANSDISLGAQKPELEVARTTLTTLHTLEAARALKAKDFIFSSTSAVYGETKVFPTPENNSNLYPISLYGAAKLSSEALVSAYVENFGLNAWVFRFGNVVGQKLTHGVIFDFAKKLKSDPTTLNVLGNGTQRKTYIHVDDCVRGILHAYEKSTAGVSHTTRFQVFNLSTQGATTVRFIAEQCVKIAAQGAAKIIYGTEDRGWVGDVPATSLDTTSMSKLGWSPKFSSDEAIIDAIKEYHAWSKQPAH